MKADMTAEEWTAIGKQLAAPFPPERIKSRPGRGGKSYSYVDARDVAERLDAVVGWQNWSDDSEVVDNETCAVLCRLTVLGVTKADIGYPNAATDAESPEQEPLKAAASDALKRAAVRFGIGRHLYRDTPHTGDSAGATGYVRQGGSARPPTPKQVQYAAGLLQQHGFPPLPEGTDSATLSRWIDTLKAEGAGARLIVPGTGQVLHSSFGGDGSMADIEGDTRANDAHIREIARPEAEGSQGAGQKPPLRDRAAIADEMERAAKELASLRGGQIPFDLVIERTAQQLGIHGAGRDDMTPEEMERVTARMRDWSRQIKAKSAVGATA